MLYAQKERFYDLLRLCAMQVAEYEARASDARRERDRAIRRAVAAQLPEKAIAVNAGVSRGWIHKVKRDRSLGT